MATDWKTVTLGDLIRLRKGISYKGEFLDRPGPRLLGLGTIALGGGIMLDKAAPYGGPIKEHHRAHAGDLLLAVVGITPVGSVIGSPALLPPAAIGEFAFTHHVARVDVLSNQSVDLHFLYYLFRTPAFHAYVWQMQSGSTVPEVSIDDVLSYEIRLPPLPEQRRIAHVLGTLDDKIELNRRMNETLEAMARALFKSWFVDFDPVRAKAEGRDPGLPKPLADLFPDSFEDSELGEIPKGWQVRPIGELAEVVGGTTPSTKEPSFWAGGTHAWATPKDLSELSFPVLLDTERRITDAGLAQIGSGLLPKGTVLLSSRAPIGYLAIAEIPVAINQGFIAMTPKPGTSNLFLLLWASVADEQILSRANGSTFLEISKSNFRPIPVVNPSVDLMRTFEEVARPLYERIVETARESSTLAILRDTLLPRLITGELRTSELGRLTPNDRRSEASHDSRRQP